MQKRKKVQKMLDEVLAEKNRLEYEVNCLAKENGGYWDEDMHSTYYHRRDYLDGLEVAFKKVLDFI